MGSSSTITNPTTKLGFDSTCVAARELYQDQANQLLQIYERQTTVASDSKNGEDEAITDFIPNELVLITGPSGVGKTCLAVVTLEERTKSDGGFFCRGKFDQSSTLGCYQVDTMTTTTRTMQHHHNTIVSNDSHRPFVTAIDDLVYQIIQRANDEDDESLDSLQTSLNEALDSSELLALESSIPGLRTITRRNSSATNLSFETEHWLSLKGPDAEKRYVQVFTKLFQAIRSFLTTTNRRIVMLMDDLQWADVHSLQLLQKLITTTAAADTTSNADADTVSNSRSALMIVCTARLDEIPSDNPLGLVLLSEPHNPLSVLLSDLKQHQQQCIVRVTELLLDDLSKMAVHQLVSRVLDLPMSKRMTQSLANVVYHQTNGNLFFIIQFLSVLEGDGHLNFCTSSNTWIWNERDTLEIFANKPTSIVSLLTHKILQLPDAEQHVLRVAACLGGTIYDCLLEERSTLSETVRSTLSSLQRHGLVTFNFTKGSGSFLHDRIQEVTYSLIPKYHQAAVHLDLGRLLWKQLAPSLLETHLFTVVTQIQRGLHLLDDRVEKEDLAALFLCAGKKAVLLSSFPAAATYFEIGIHLLGRRGWKYQYRRSLALYNAAAEVEYYNGSLARVDALLAEIFDNAKSLDDKLRAHITQIYSFGSRDDMKQALGKGLDVLKMLGTTFPRRPGKLNASFALGRCCRLLQSMSDDGIMRLPLMTNHHKLVVMRLLNTIYGYAFSNNEALVALIATRMIETTVRHGISALSCVGFALLGFCMGHRGQAEQSYRFGRLALQMMERFQAKEWQCRVALLVFGGVYSVLHPLKDLVKPLQSAHRAGMVAGDINASLVCASFQCRMGFYASEPLPYVVKRLEEYRRLCGYYGQMSVSMMLSPQLQICYNFMGRAADPLLLTGEAMDEKATIAFIQGKHPVALTWLLLSKHFLAVYFNDLQGATAVATLLSKMKIGAVLPFVLHNHLFLEGLTAATLSRSDTKQIKRATRNLAKFKSLQTGAGENYENKIHLLEAEMAASRGEREHALLKYNQSIDASRRQGFLHEQALACEKAGYSFLHWGEFAKSRDYLISASTLYGQWGAAAKVKQVDAVLCGLLLKL